MSDITTSVDAKRDFNQAAGNEQHQSQDTGSGAPDRITPDFNRAASGEQKETSREKPEAALNREPGQGELSKGGQLDNDRSQRMQQMHQQQLSRGPDRSHGF